jgi:hypothetical protein
MSKIEDQEASKDESIGETHHLIKEMSVYSDVRESEEDDS